MLESIIVAGITAISGVVGYAIKSRTDGSSTRSADWQKFTSEMREWTERRLAERDEDIAELRAEVNGLRTELQNLSGRYTAALRYVQRLWRDNRVEPPTDIANDLPLPPWADH